MTTVGRAVASVVAGFARLVTRAKVQCLGELPMTEQCIYFANHSSHMDFVVLWSLLPSDVREKTRPVAAADYWSKGLKRLLACDVFRAVLVDRASKPAAIGSDAEAQRSRAIRPLIDVLAGGESLILFPEGTRGNGLEVARFKSGLYNLCVARPGLKLVPVYLKNLNRVLPKGGFVPTPMRSEVTFGAPIGLREGEGREEFLVRARATLLELRDA
ncbi:MAG TPA: lysophospholipid acyltransferase family protein [Acidobacteriaceae bacterium]|nr:lysophospholipid acyltransferase family protein [Acidobacteriaceae bacterium]